MKKLIASAIVAAAIALPAAPAVAADADAWWGRKPCAWGEVGTVVWHDTPATDYQEIRLCIPIYPGDGTDRAADPGRAGVSKCTVDGTVGVYVWYYDLQGGYHATRCISTGP